MKLPIQYQLIAAGLVLALTFGAGFGLRALIADRDEAKTELRTFVQFGKAINQRDKAFAVQSAKLTALETQFTKDLNNAVASNTALRDDLAVAQRMRLKGTTCPARSASGAATAGGADGVQVELSEATRRLVFDLRESIVRDQATIAGLQAELAARSQSCAAVAPAE